jgi:stage IV sporulation protein FB
MRGGVAEAIGTIAFILAIFASVVTHEYGHVLTARALGIKTRDITLLPIGGVASIDRMPERPRDELLITIAGPLVNVVIALALIGFFGARIIPLDPSSIENGAGEFASRLAAVNVMLFAFNLLPAFPMDGGRILRAILASLMDRMHATRIASTIGQAVAFALGFIGLFANPLLIFIALFIFLAARHEAMEVELGEATRNASVSRAAITSFRTLDSQSTVQTAVDALLATSQTEFPVVDESKQLRGVLTRDGIIQALASGGPTTPVSEVMITDVAVVNRRAPLADAVSQLRSGAHSLVGVVDDGGHVIGIITLENLGEYMLIDRAMRERKDRLRPAA